ncbi:hypothetical protein P691DRAFT_493856 [Macrolepiota fuliginosa MF-IS2]|uniref:DUF6534 domain-containing protein n=1 Tax=Macrolepiota fuliginosa MF-IS2 TaxID=1400762 RepID=A0A9P5XH73_9AGAR|nr:hypothetical protein P691DRAFT_493856 [Macrolepiota fuliginosa MF-IS2]
MVKVRERGAPVATFPIILWVVAMVICDLVIAIVMTYYLVKLNKEFQQSSVFVRKLMTLTIETGSATALTAILVVVLSIGKPDSEAYNIPAFLVGKLHSNSLLRVLNNRNRTQYVPDVITLPISLDSLPVSRGGSRSRGEDEGGARLEVELT